MIGTATDVDHDTLTAAWDLNGDGTFETAGLTPSFRGIDGPVRPLGRGTVEPVGEGSRTRVTIELDFAGHGLGKLLLPLVRSQARKQVPKDHQRLKEQLESGVAGAGGS